jgi:hypothetical protein
LLQFHLLRQSRLWNPLNLDYLLHLLSQLLQWNQLHQLRPLLQLSL